MYHAKIMNQQYLGIFLKRARAGRFHGESKINGNHLVSSAHVLENFDLKQTIPVMEANFSGRTAKQLFKKYMQNQGYDIIF